MDLSEKQLLASCVSLLQFSFNRGRVYNKDDYEFVHSDSLVINGFKIEDSQNEEYGCGFRITVIKNLKEYVCYLSTFGEVNVEGCTIQDFVNAVYEEYDKNNHFLKVSE